MAEQHVARVIIEGEASSFVAASSKSARSAEEFRKIVEKTGKSLAEQEKAAKAAGDASENHRQKQEKATGAALAFSKAVDTAKEGTFGVAKAATAAAASFGPWGIAIAVVGHELVDFIEKTVNAAEATRKLRKEQEEAAKTRALAFRAEREADEEAQKIAQDRRKYDQIARQYRERHDAMREEYLAGEEAKEKQRHSAKKKRSAETIAMLNNELVAQRALGFAGFRGNVAGKSDSMRFDAEAGRVGAMQREGSDTRGANDAQYAAEAQLQALEIQRATTGETLSLINQEEEARRRLLQTQIDAATIGAERQQLQAEIEAVHHEARLKRIDLERAAEEKKAARKVALMDLVDRVAAGSAATANMIAKTAGASAKKQEQIAAGVAGGQAIIIGVLETVKAAAAFASFNYVQGAAHTAAAVFAYAQGGMLLAQAGGAGSSRGGGGAAGGGMPSGGTQSSPSGQTFRGSDSEIPGSPQAPSAARGSSSGPNRTTVININGDVVGTPRKEFIRSIREGLDLDSQGGRARRTGSG